jgi:thioredoxin reductase
VALPIGGDARPSGIGSAASKCRKIDAHQGVSRRRPIQGTHEQDSGVELDAKGFVRTGNSKAGRGSNGRADQPFALETNLPGVFAVGDVRSGSVKRVGGAIGEGAAVVTQLHKMLTVPRDESANDIRQPPRRTLQ